LIEKVQINPERLEMFNLSAAMGPRWAEICREFTDKIKNLGPSPVRMSIQHRKEQTKGAINQ